MKAISTDIHIDENELSDACWMPIKDFMNTTKHPMNKIVFSIFDDAVKTEEHGYASLMEELEMQFIKSRRPFKFYIPNTRIDTLMRSRTNSKIYLLCYLYYCCFFFCTSFFFCIIIDY